MKQKLELWVIKFARDRERREIERGLRYISRLDYMEQKVLSK